METLELRRKQLSLTFAKKAQKSEKFNQWFRLEDTSEPNIRTRNFKPKPKFKPVTCIKCRFRKSPIPYLTELLNEQK